MSTNWPGQEISGGGSQSGTTLEPIYSRPNNRADAQDARDEKRLGLDIEQEARSGRNERDQDDDRRFQRETTLQSRYEALQPVKDYRAMLPQAIQALQLLDDPTADQTLLYAYAKAMDPGSVVRESEQGAAANGAGYWDASVANLKKQFGIEGGGLDPNVRSRLKRDLINRLQQNGLQYRNQRKRFADDASASGVDPARVIGPDDFDPFLSQWESYQARQRGNVSTGQAGAQTAPGATGAPNGVTDPTLRGGLPVGSQIEWSADQPEQPFDRGRYLEKLGINEQQEAQWIAFLNQNAGNPNLSVETANQWLASKGIAYRPNPAALQQLIADLRSGKYSGVGPIDTTAAEQQYRQQLQGDLQREGFDPTSGGSYAARAARGLELGLSDEIEGIGGGIEALLNNRGVADGYRLARDRSREAFSEMEDQQGIPGYVAEFAGGLAGPVAEAAGAKLLGVSRGPLTAAEAAKQAGIAGTVAGFGYGEGAGDSLTGAALGGVTGTGLGFGIGRGAEALAARRAAQAAAPASEGAQVIQAADDLNAQLGTNLQPIPADVGGVNTRRATGWMAQLPLSAGSIIRGAENLSNEAQAARDAIAALTGTAGTRERAGEAALTGAQKYIKSSKTKVDALYAKARRLGGDEPVDLANARQVLDDNIAELAATPGGAPGLARLQALRDTLDQPYPVEGVKRMRSTLRDEFLGEGLRNSDLERRVGMVVDAADDDITTALNTAGKGEAARAYQEAAAAYKERVGVIDDILAPIIGKDRNNPRSDEQVIGAIEAATKKDGAGLGKFLSALPAEDASTVRATLISRLGRNTNGGQNAAGDAFSLPRFLTHWNELSNNAKSQLFGGEVRAALENLAKVAEGTKEAQKFANFSNTGSVVGGIATGAQLPGFFVAPISTTVALASQFGAGKLLASPSFARWLAKMPSNPGLIERHVSALSRIAANDNAIAQDVIGLKSALEGVLAPTARSAAAPAPSAETSAGSQTGERR